MTTKAPTLSAIAALANNRVIGLDGSMPWHYKEDLQHFKSMTMDKVMIMGRVTFDSFSKPLPGRHHLVLTRDASLIDKVVALKDDFTLSYVENKDAAFARAKELGFPPIVIGGAKIYELFWPSINILHLTHIAKTFDGDAFFPSFEDEFSQIEVRDSENFEELSYATWQRI